MKILRGIIAILLVPISILAVITAYGCDGNTPPTATPALPPGGGDVNRVINEAHQNMTDLKSFHFTVQGAKDGTPNLKIEGDLERPDKTRSTYEQPDQGKGELIVYGQDTYLKQPDSQTFVMTEGGNVPPDIVGTLLNPQMLTYYALLGSDQKIAGEEKVDGVDTVKVSFTFNPNDVQKHAAEILSQPTPRPSSGSEGTFKGDLWVEKGTNQVRRLQWLPPIPGVGTPEAGVQRTVLVTYSKFNEPPSPPIAPPAVAVTRTPSPASVPVPTTAP